MGLNSDFSSDLPSDRYGTYLDLSQLSNLPNEGLEVIEEEDEHCEPPIKESMYGNNANTKSIGSTWDVSFSRIMSNLNNFLGLKLSFSEGHSVSFIRKSTLSDHSSPEETEAAKVDQDNFLLSACYFIAYQSKIFSRKISALMNAFNRSA